MRKLILALAMGVVAVGSGSEAQAYHGTNLGFIPFGFYQPYGVRYSTSVRTPPYFAINPPVYYGSRYHRPYGVSPFASPPQVSVPADYQAQRAPQQAVRPQHLGRVVHNHFVIQDVALPVVNTHVAPVVNTHVAPLAGEEVAPTATDEVLPQPTEEAKDADLLPPPAEASETDSEDKAEDDSNTAARGPIRTNPYVLVGSFATR